MNPRAAETLYHLMWKEGRCGGLQKTPLFDMGRHGMKDSEEGLRAGGKRRAEVEPRGAAP